MKDAALLQGVKAHFKTNDVATASNGFFVRGHGFVSTSKARKLTGITGEKRERRGRQGAWGDYATIAMLNRPRTKVPR